MEPPPGWRSRLMTALRLRKTSLLLGVALLVLATGCFSEPQAPPPASPTPQASTEGGDCLATVGGLDLQSATLAEIQDALAAGRVTSVQLVDAYTARIAAYAAGPKLNSVQMVNPHAREQAAALDAERAAGHVRGPLHGIPILLKDNVGTND